MCLECGVVLFITADAAFHKYSLNCFCETCLWGIHILILCCSCIQHFISQSGHMVKDFLSGKLPFSLPVERSLFLTVLLFSLTPGCVWLISFCVSDYSGLCEHTAYKNSPESLYTSISINRPGLPWMGLWVSVCVCVCMGVCVCVCVCDCVCIYGS